MIKYIKQRLSIADIIFFGTDTLFIGMFISGEKSLLAGILCYVWLQIGAAIYVTGKILFKKSTISVAWYQFQMRSIDLIIITTTMILLAYYTCHIGW